ncbi:MAG TPA: ABC transporter permease [Candidatus Nanoarchaeia archaeon]|nr:ABC transporter permease [Candidatus Nanoarchaeia archaeon]
MKRLIIEAWAMALRDIKKRESIFKYLMAITLFGLAIFFVGFAFDLFVDFSAYSTSFAQYFSSGILIYFVALIGIQSSAELVIDRQGFTKLLLVAPIARGSLLLGKVLTGFIDSIRGYLLVIIFFLWYFGTFDPLLFAVMIAFMFWTIVTFTGLGLWLSSLFTNKYSAQTAEGMLVFGFLFFSGIFYPLAIIPEPYRYLLYVNPLTYSVDFFRFLMGSTPFLPLSHQLIGVIGFGILFLYLGVYQFDRFLRR